MEKKVLEERLQKYTYAQPSILEGKSMCFYNPLFRQVQVTPFYEEDESSTTGTCLHLSYRGLQELKEAFPNHHFYMAKGHETEFFFPTEQYKNPTHWFLLAIEGERRGPLETETQKDIDNIEQRNPIVIDPSLQKIIEYSASDYHIQDAISQDAEIFFKALPELDKNMLDKEKFLRPVIKEESIIAYLAVKYEREEQEPELNIALQKPCCTPQIYHPTTVLAMQEVGTTIKQYAEAIQHIPIIKKEKEFFGY